MMASYTDYHFMNKDLREHNERAQAKREAADGGAERMHVELERVAPLTMSRGGWWALLITGIVCCLTVFGIPLGLIIFGVLRKVNVK